MVRCPACAQPLEETGQQTAAGVLCTNCHHLWTVRDGVAGAVNAGHPGLTENPAPVVDERMVEFTLAEPADAPDSGVMTAEKAAPFIPKELG